MKKTQDKSVLADSPAPLQWEADVTAYTKSQLEGKQWHAKNSTAFALQSHCSGLVVWVKFCKLIMGSGEGPFPSEPPLARSPNLASEGGGEGRGRPFPLVDLSEPQAAVFNLSRCASLRNVMLR
jgi:hypothetical protein